MSLPKKKIGAIPTVSIQDKNTRDALVRASEYILELERRLAEVERQLTLVRRKP